MKRRTRSPAPDPIEAAAQAVLGRFRRSRPLRAGSLLVTLLGDAVSPRGGTISLASLIRLSAPFGISERLVRTSVGRLAQDGWLAATRRGRLSYYRLTPAGRRRFAEATRRIYGATPSAWNGRWLLILMPRGLNERRRRELHWQGFGPVHPGVLARPAARRERLPAALRGHALRAQALTDRSERRLLAQGWNLSGLGGRYRRFVALFAPVRRALEGRPVPPGTTPFVLRTLLIHEYRKVHLRDPLLPKRLLPAGWSGHEAELLARTLYARLFLPAEQHLTATARGLKGPLPSPSPATYRRFGGLPR